MKQKKDFKYHLKNDVRFDLAVLHSKISYLLIGDLEGFDTIPSWSILPALFKVYSHLVWCTKFQSRSGVPKEPFKKVYERQIPFDDSLTFPYSSLYSSMRFLYGDDCMVSFIVY